MTYIKLKIRRLYIGDEQWNRTSESWKLLEHHRNFDCFDENDESILTYCERVKKVITVPEDVAEQWLYCHYYNENTVDNYGWINYEKSIFQCDTISIEDAINLRVIKKYSQYVQSRSYTTPFDGFMCNPKDKNHWIHKRTWRVPPIIVDVQSFSKPPSYADFSGSYQIMEGHTRLGYLLSMYRTGEKLKEQHQVYILRSQ